MVTTMRCPRCEAFYREYPPVDGMHILEEEADGGQVRMGAITCAFPHGTFSGDNWNCETMDAVRAFVNEWYEDAPRWFCWMARDDMRSASIGVLPIPECGESSGDTQDAPDAIQQGYLVMTWYKDRGRTGQAWVMWDDEEPQRLNLPTAEFIIAHFANEKTP